MQIDRIVLGMYQTNCYIVRPDGAKQCVVVDPAGEAGRLLSMLDKLGVEPTAVLLTHGHYDHILAVPALQQRWPDLPVYCHPLDCPEALEEYDMGMTFPTVSAFHNVLPLEDAQQLTLAGVDFKVMHTPGHTPGSVVFMTETALFTGDTLFCGDIGRTDFAGGSQKQMMESLVKLASLTGDYAVYPGHDVSSTMEQERRHNPYLRAAQMGRGF